MKKKIIGILLALTLTIGLLAGCGSKEKAVSAGSAETYKVRLAATDAGISIYQAIAEANNLTDGLNLEVEWIDGLSSGPEIIAAISGESVDIGKIGDFPVVTNYGGGETPVFKVVGYAVRGTDSLLFVGADSGIESIEDLAGKTVGTQIGTGSQFQLETSLAKGGLTIEDVNLVNLDNGSWLSTFVSGEVDAVCILTDVTVANDELGEITRLDETEHALQSFIANSEWAEENPQAVARTLILFHRVYEYYAENPDKAIEQVVDAYPDVSAERVKFILDELSDTVLSGEWDTAISRYTDLKEFALGAGTIGTDFDVNTTFDDSYVKLAKEINVGLE